MAENTAIQDFISALSATYTDEQARQTAIETARTAVKALADNYDRYTTKRFVEMFSKVNKATATIGDKDYTMTAAGVESLFTTLDDGTALEVTPDKVYNDVTNDAVILGGEFAGNVTETQVANHEPIISYSPKTYNVQGKDVIINDATIINAGVVVPDAAGKLVINALTVDNTNGNLSKAVTNSNRVLKVVNGKCESIVLKEMTMKATDTVAGKNLYNGVEFWAGANCKSILIEKCAFLGSYTHNAVNVYSCADNCVITVKNCYFDNFNKDGNILRLSNINAAKNVHIIFDNCVFDHWDGDSLAEGQTNQYAGFCLCQDYTSGSVEAEKANALFGPDKIKITLKNCTGPVSAYSESNGMIPAFDSAEEVCATGKKNQLCYVYGNKSGVFAYNNENAALYPEIVVIPGVTDQSKLPARA